MPGQQLPAGLVPFTAGQQISKPHRAGEASQNLAAASYPNQMALNRVPTIVDQPLFSMTLDELQNSIPSGKPFGSLNLDEFLQTVWDKDPNLLNTISNISDALGGDSAIYGAENAGRGHSMPNLNQLPPAPALNLPSDFSGKTVDEVWREIHSSGPKTSFNNVTLGNFLETVGVMSFEGFQPHMQPPAYTLGTSNPQIPQQHRPPLPLGTAGGPQPLQNFAPPHRPANPAAGQAVKRRGKPGAVPRPPGAAAAAAAAPLLPPTAPTRQQKGASISGQHRQHRHHGQQQQQQQEEHHSPTVQLPTHNVSPSLAGSPSPPTSHNGSLPQSPTRGLPPVPPAEQLLPPEDHAKKAVSAAAARAARQRKRKDPSSADEHTDRASKRMVKNRESAARSRQRKQQYTAELEEEVEALKKANRDLREKVVKVAAVAAFPKPVVAELLASPPPLRRTNTLP